jgi:hypothetical protein
MDRFELQGIVYYQQGRKCGKPDCACASEELHGPYWYSRDVAYNKVSYLGKELPGNVAKARAALTKSQARIKAKIAEIAYKVIQLEKQENALKLLSAGMALSPSHKAIVQKFGFKSCLVLGETDLEQGQHKTEMATA